MKKDIEGRPDIELLVNTFYEKVRNNSSIAHFFKDVVNVNWDKHLPNMYNFWENVLFYSGSYDGNPMRVHKTINSRHNFSEDDFKVWLELFTSTVDELFEGEKAALAKQRAYSIATVMRLKILYPDNFNSFGT